MIVHPNRGAELERMYVCPSALGSGIADTLLANAFTMAADRQCPRLAGTVRGAMDAAISVYRRNGFSIAR